MDLDILNLFDRIRDRWENRSGLFMGSIFLIAIYFAIVSFFTLRDKGVSDFLIIIVIPILIVGSLFFFWVTNTNRFFIKLGDKISVGVTVIVDSDRDRLLINKIVKKVIDQINHNDEFSNLDLKLLPTNFCIHDKQVNRYYKNFNFMYDLIIRITAESGHFDSIEKIIITKLSVTFRPKSRLAQKKVFFNIVDLTQDMALQVKSRDWEYLLKNDGIDKVKYLGNIYHIILYYIGFYAIYSNRYADAMRVMTPIYDARKTKLKLANEENNRHTFQLTPYNIAEGRLATILIDLYFYAAVKSYQQRDTKEAMSNFMRLEVLVKDHPNKFSQFINMARYSYELGNLTKAIEYTEEALKLKPNSLEIFLNLGFFAILENSIKKFCENYNKLYLYRSNSGTINWLDVLDFQLRQKDELKDRLIFFNFSTSFIEYVFIGSIEVDEFQTVVDQYQSDERYECFFQLGTQVILGERYKANSANISKSRKSRKKRKK